MTLPSGKWTLDPATTRAAFTVKNWMFRTVEGSFAVLEGTAEVADDASAGSLEVTIDTTSFDTGNGKRDHHVKSPDFLAADRHPQGTFVSSSVAETPDGFRVGGELSVGAGSAPVEFDLTLVDTDDGRAAFRATATVDRRALGITRMPNMVIGHEITVTVDGTATRD